MTEVDTYPQGNHHIFVDLSAVDLGFKVDDLVAIDTKVLNENRFCLDAERSQWESNEITL